MGVSGRWFSHDPFTWTWLSVARPVVPIGPLGGAALQGPSPRGDCRAAAPRPKASRMRRVPASSRSGDCDVPALSGSGGRTPGAGYLVLEEHRRVEKV